ncbi:sensor histidine kinase NtrY-like [Paracoccus saliphilus]|uniref:histidine kinase n=1 Tax=Paracoccus saliphilus TaxID=405559 RepID=A0AA46A6W8_9RHOB|nr:PAS domain-containing sensor histidine kinase [Paracoccus saliphilus]WCR03774.1 PAS domain-containing sensor histidine kinase [Paracoccus saliphilus]SIT04541.1 PAS/PAC sensor signal transduction histidine kinase [Paracoccus saliphilus]
MAGSVSGLSWDRLANIRLGRQWRGVLTWGLLIAGALLMVATLSVLGPLSLGVQSQALRMVLLLDLFYLIVLIALVLARMARLISARRHSDAGSRLHRRLVMIFAGLALVPTVLVALFAGVLVNIGLEGWFSDRVQQVVTNSQAAAEAYQEEHRHDLTEDARALAGVLTQAGRANPLIGDGEMRQLLVQGQALIQRGLREAYVIDGTGTIRSRGERSYLFWYEEPSSEQLDQAQSDGLVLIEDWDNNEFRALVALPPLADRYLYVTRDVDGNLLGLLDDTRATVGDYRQLEQTRGQVLFEFSLVYLGFALLLVAAAMWMGLWFASRLSRPIGLLAEASEQVGRGNLDLQIPEPDTGDEIQTLGQSFNRMTRQLKTQREELVESYRASDEQRRLFDNVLTSVTSGVIGLDAQGGIDFLNRSAIRLLGLEPGRDIDAPLSDAVPEFAALFQRLSASVAETVQDEIRLTRDGQMESLLVRMAVRRNTDGELEGYVVAFDDVTELVSAQRMAAWGDVARRVAHEIKNPLTPIQLSAERLRRKFTPLAGPEDKASLDQYVEVIIRQTGDLRRIVDEFSRFARMPEPDRAEIDLAELLRASVFLQQDALKGALEADIPDQPVIVDCDEGMLRQAFTNLLKNAGEAVEERAGNAPEGWAPRVSVTMETDHDSVTIRITDNGPGLPADRSRLFEPYVTLKTQGTGLGLPIVKKIVEEHGGSLSLTDAPDRDGAMAEIRLPRERNPVRGTQRRTRQERDEAGTT